MPTRISASSGRMDHPSRRIHEKSDGSWDQSSGMNDRSGGSCYKSDRSSDQRGRMKDRSAGICYGSDRTSGGSGGIRLQSRNIQQKAWKYSIKEEISLLILLLFQAQKSKMSFSRQKYLRI